MQSIIGREALPLTLYVTCRNRMVASGGEADFAFISIDTLVVRERPSYLARAPRIEFWCILQAEDASNWGENIVWEFLAAPSAYVTTCIPA